MFVVHLLLASAHTPHQVSLILQDSEKNWSSSFLVLTDMVDGLLANVGTGTVPLFRSSSLATGVPVPICTGTDPAAPGVVE